MKKIYILLMHTNTIPSKLIKFFTRYKYTHVGLSLDKSCNTIYSFGRKNLHSFIKGGFVIENRDGAFFQTFNRTTCQVYELSVTEEKYNSLKHILEEMVENIQDYKYDFLGLIPRFFGIPVTTKNKYVCSFFVAEVLEKAEIIKFKKETCLVYQKDFSKREELSKVYEGSYLMYSTET